MQKTHFFLDFFYQIYAYREFLKQSVLRDLRTKYKRSSLGYLWTMLHPLGMMAVLAVVFSNIMRMPIKDFAIFLFAGLLAWNYFSSTVMMSLNNIRANSRLFSQIPLPKYIFIISLVCSNLVNFFLALIPLLILMLVFQRPISWIVLAFPVMLLPFLCVVVGVSLILATSNVFFDDTLHLTEVAMSALYFLSPVLYQREMLPAWLVKYLVVLNPLFCEIEFIRVIFYDGVLPDASIFFVNFAGALLVLASGLWIFHRSESKFMYFI